MTQTKYSIAEARNRFTALIRDAEKTTEPIQVTRRGQPVVVILSTEEYARLLGQQQKQDSWQVYINWRTAWQVDEWEEDPDLFADIRDQSSGRDIDLWE